MSRPCPVAVHGDMRFPSPKAPSRLTRRISAGLLVVLVGGCGPKLEVLRETGGVGGDDSAAGAPGGGGRGGAAGTSAGMSAAGTSGGGSTAAGGEGSGGLEGESICGASGLTSPEEVAALTMGEACSDKDICEPNACASVGMPSESNIAAFVACRNHRLQVVTMTLLDVPPSDVWAVREGAVNWDDCESALDEGTSGDTCTWLSQSCVRHTDDPCCLEGAQCLSFTPLTPPEGLLHRTRLCAPGCTDVTPDSPAPVVTDCETAAAADTCHETPACEGDFICHRSLPEPAVSEYTETSQVNGAMWCAGNVLVGGYGLSWGF